MLVDVELADLGRALRLGEHELVSLVGGGGKTTALFALGSQLSGSRVLTTTTKMGRNRTSGVARLLAPTDEEISSSLGRDGVVLVWAAEDNRKAFGVDPRDCDRWFGQFDHVVVEADGSRRKPFKAPRDYEPVVPAATTVLIACVGMAAIGEIIASGCQRPELVAGLAGCGADAPLTESRLARVLLHPRGSRKACPPSSRFVVLLNQVTLAREPVAAAVAAAVHELDPTVSVIGIRDFS